VSGERKQLLAVVRMPTSKATRRPSKTVGTFWELPPSSTAFADRKKSYDESRDDRPTLLGATTPRRGRGLGAIFTSVWKNAKTPSASSSSSSSSSSVSSATATAQPTTGRRARFSDVDKKGRAAVLREGATACTPAAKRKAATAVSSNGKTTRTTMAPPPSKKARTSC
jgi:hypothetical protein